ncbi:MAG: glycosyltransferase family 4 protein [Acidimicrobiia bacterium]
MTNAYAPNLGGVETYVQNLATELGLGGDSVVVCTQTADRRLPALETVAAGVVVRRFRLPVRTQHYGLSPGLVRHLRRASSEYDVINAHNYHGLPALAATWSRRPLVLTPHFHSSSASRFRSALHRPYRILGRRLVRRSTAIVCVSNAEADLVKSAFPDAAPRIVIVPPGIDSPGRAEPFPEPRTVVLSVGRLEDYKQVDRLIEAMSYLGGEYHLVVVGDGPELRRLQRQASSAPHPVTFTGRISDAELGRWYATAAVYVSLSRLEAYGLSVAAALARGVPVVASDIPAHRELLAAGVSTALVDPAASANEVAGAITAARGRRMPSQSLASWPQTASQTHALYESVLKRTASVGYDA